MDNSNNNHLSEEEEPRATIKSRNSSRKSSRTSKNLNSMMTHLQDTLSLAKRQAEEILRRTASIDNETGYTIHEGRRPNKIEPEYNTLTSIQEKVRALQLASADLQNSIRPANTHPSHNGTRKSRKSRSPQYIEALRRAKEEKLKNNKDPIINAYKKLREMSSENKSRTHKTKTSKQPGEWSNTNETYTIQTRK